MDNEFTTALEIADEIARVVDLTLSNQLSVEECGTRTRELWDSARAQGLEMDVDRILQSRIEAELASLLLCQ
jgi:hypothetical protein